MHTLFIFLVVVYLYIAANSLKVPVKQDVYWKFHKGELPEDAIEGAPGKYIGSMLHYGRIPATILYSSGVTTIAMKGIQVNSIEHVLIMCSANPSRFYWEEVDTNTTLDQQMKDAVVGGLYNDYLVTLYIGKAVHQEEWKIGRVIANDHHLRGLWVWDSDRKEAHVHKFQILKYNSTGAWKCR